MVVGVKEPERKKRPIYCAYTRPHAHVHNGFGCRGPLTRRSTELASRTTFETRLVLSMLQALTTAEVAWARLVVFEGADYRFHTRQSTMALSTVYLWSIEANQS